MIHRIKVLQRLIRDPDTFRIDMSWKLATALAVGLLTGATLAVTWAYAYGDKLVATADAHRDQALVAYPTWPQVLQTMREERQEIDAANSARQTEILKRLDRLEDRLMRR